MPTCAVRMRESVRRPPEERARRECGQVFVKKCLCEKGVWNFLRALPYSDFITLPLIGVMMATGLGLWEEL
jgi:hypothetical protein